MNLLPTTEFKVGILVASIAGLIVWMSLRISEDPSYLGTAQKLNFVVNDASGLIKKSAVKMAGIDVGVIKDIQLKNSKAYIELAIRPDLEITESAQIEIRANGILGDKYIEIIAGQPGDRVLGDNENIEKVKDVGSLAALMNEVGQIASSLNGVAKSLEDATSGQGNRDTPLGRIVNNLEVFTGDLAEITQTNKVKLAESMDNIHSISKEIRGLVADESDTGFKAAWARAVSSLDKLDRSLTNIEEVTEKVRRGEGTIGKLINDEETVNGLNTAVEQVNEFFGSASQMQTTVDFHSSYLAQSELAKSALSVKIQPGLDRYYEIGIVDDPMGVTERTDRTIITNPGAGQTSESTQTTEIFKNKIKFNALFAKNFFDFSLKGGLIESTGGIGLDYYVYGKKLILGLEAFDFQDTNLRANLRWNFYKGIYVQAGGEQLLSSEDSSSYVGAGLFLTNDDLKLLLSGMSLQ